MVWLFHSIGRSPLTCFSDDAQGTVESALLNQSLANAVSRTVLSLSSFSHLITLFRQAPIARFCFSTNRHYRGIKAIDFPTLFCEHEHLGGPSETAPFHKMEITGSLFPVTLVIRSPGDTPQLAAGQSEAGLRSGVTICPQLDVGSHFFRYQFNLSMTERNFQRFDYLLCVENILLNNPLTRPVTIVRMSHHI
jgi:hypothetical protein